MITDLNNFQNSEFENLKKMTLYNNSIAEIPPLNFPTIETLLLFDNSITCIDGLSNSDLSQVTIISLYKNKIKKLPHLKLKTLEKLYIYRN